MDGYDETLMLSGFAGPNSLGKAEEPVGARERVTEAARCRFPRSARLAQLLRSIRAGGPPQTRRNRSGSISGGGPGGIFARTNREGADRQTPPGIMATSRPENPPQHP